MVVSGKLRVDSMVTDGTMVNIWSRTLLVLE